MNTTNLLKRLLVFTALTIIFCPLVQAESGFSNSDKDNAALNSPSASKSEKPFQNNENEGFDNEEGFSEEAFEEIKPEEKEKEKSGFGKELAKWLSGSRVTLKHEYSYKTEQSSRVVNNRSIFRFELSRFLGERFFIKVDSNLNLFYRDDHRIRTDLDKEYMTEIEVREAYAQASFGNTNLKLGYQILIWGEADGRAITDVISPRDMSEFFFIPLEESRVGQFMLVVDQYNVLSGDLTLFYNPRAEFDEKPDFEGEYYISLVPEFKIKAEEYGDDTNLDEYGARWKISSGKSDFAVIVASLIENTCAYEDFKINDDFDLQLKRTNQRYLMSGIAFNYALGSYLLRGEAARKSKRTFNNLKFEVLEKDVVDASLGLEYSSSGGGYHFSVDVFNSRILGWEEDILVYPENETNILANWNKKFLNDELSVNLSTIFGFNYDDRVYILETGYDYDDQIKLELNFLAIDISDKESVLWLYRDQNRVTARLSYLF